MATNMYLKLDGIEGGSTAEGHKKELEILSWSHGFSQPTSAVRSSAGSGSVEQANHSDISISKYLDSATDDILKACWTGKQIKNGVLTCYRADGAADNKSVEYLKIEMDHIIVSNYSISGGGGDMAMENVSLAYGIVKYTYLPQKKEDGTGGAAQPISHNLETLKVE